MSFWPHITVAPAASGPSLSAQPASISLQQWAEAGSQRLSTEQFSLEKLHPACSSSALEGRRSLVQDALPVHMALHLA